MTEAPKDIDVPDWLLPKGSVRTPDRAYLDYVRWQAVNGHQTADGIDRIPCTCPSDHGDHAVTDLAGRVVFACPRTGCDCTVVL